MKAIILAAGDAKRLRPLTDNMPKCLIQINGKAIIDSQVGALVENGFGEVVVVVGFLAEKIMMHLTVTYPRVNFKFIYNPRYSVTNTVYSLWLASYEMNSDFMYFNADVLLDGRIIEGLLASKENNCLAVKRQNCGDEEVKVIVANGLVLDIGKNLDAGKCFGEFIGVARFSKTSSEAFKNSMRAVVDEGDVNAFFELALKRMITGGGPRERLAVLDVLDMPCIEIDTPEDLRRAREEIAPLLRERRR